MSAEGLNKALTLQRLSEICAPHEWEHVEAAFDGDADAAFSLSVALSNSKRGAVAVAMWRAKVEREAFRAYFESVWGHDHRHVIAAAESRRTLGHMFRYAAFAMPAELPDVVTLWRGSSWLTIAEAKKGYSWTTDRSTACWFAVRFAQANGRPPGAACRCCQIGHCPIHQRPERKRSRIDSPARCRSGGRQCERLDSRLSSQRGINTTERPHRLTDSGKQGATCNQFCPS